MLTRGQFGEATPHRQTELNLEAKFLELRNIHVLPIKIDLVKNVLISTRIELVFLLVASMVLCLGFRMNDVGNTLMF